MGDVLHFEHEASTSDDELDDASIELSDEDSEPGADEMSSLAALSNSESTMKPVP